MAVCGITLFTYEDGFKSGDTVNSVIGVALSLGSSVGAALYKVRIPCMYRYTDDPSKLLSSVHCGSVMYAGTVSTLCTILHCLFYYPLSLQVLLKVRVKEASIYQMSLFLTSLGVFSTIIFWPVVLILQFTGVEVIHGQTVEIPWLFICASSALTVVFNFSINFGIAYTYPLFISLGTVLGIPINGVVDLLVRQVNLFTTWKFTATDLIVGGFLLMLLPPRSSRWVHRTCCCDCYCCDKTQHHKLCVNQT